MTSELFHQILSILVYCLNGLGIITIQTSGIKWIAAQVQIILIIITLWHIVQLRFSSQTGRSKSGADLERWGCDLSVYEARTRKLSSHAHLMKTTPILIATGSPLYPVHRHSSKCKTSGFTTACLECGFTTCSELTTTTTMLFAV